MHVHCLVRVPCNLVLIYGQNVTDRTCNSWRIHAPMPLLLRVGLFVENNAVDGAVESELYLQRPAKSSYQAGHIERGVTASARGMNLLLAGITSETGCKQALYTAMFRSLAAYQGEA